MKIGHCDCSKTFKASDAAFSVLGSGYDICELSY